MFLVTCGNPRYQRCIHVKIFAILFPERFLSALSANKSYRLYKYLSLSALSLEIKIEYFVG